MISASFGTRHQNRSVRRWTHQLLPTVHTKRSCRRGVGSWSPGECSCCSLPPMLHCSVFGRGGAQILYDVAPSITSQRLQQLRHIPPPTAQHMAFRPGESQQRSVSSWFLFAVVACIGQLPPKVYSHVQLKSAARVQILGRNGRAMPSYGVRSAMSLLFFFCET